MQQRMDLPGLVRRALQAAVIAVLAVQLDRRNYGNVYICVLTLVLFAVPQMLRRRFGVELSGTMELLILAFLFGAEILGEVGACYQKIPCWDVLLHGLSGFLAGAVGYALTVRNDGRLLPAATAFCFSMTIGVLWEFLEWGVDLAFGLDMQKDTVLHALSSVCLNVDGGNSARAISGISDTVVLCSDGTLRSLGLGGYLDVGLRDTMGDLLVNLLGAAAFSGCVVWRRSLAEQFVPQIKKHSGEQ